MNDYETIENILSDESNFDEEGFVYDEVMDCVDCPLKEACKSTFEDCKEAMQNFVSQE